VQLELSQDDEAGLGRVPCQLLDGFGGWLRAQPGLDEAAAHDATVDAGIALDWKFGYGDGHLASPARLRAEAIGAADEFVTAMGDICAATDLRAQ